MSVKHFTDYKVTRKEFYSANPLSLIVDWSKNVSRNGEEPAITDDLKALAMSMLPKNGEDGGIGQQNPILCRRRVDKQIEVVGGFRRMRAALWLLESGTAPDFEIKYTICMMNDLEAALINISENVERSEPEPIQIAHAIRKLNEDFGLSLDNIAKRLKRSITWVTQRLELVNLSHEVQQHVASGEVPVSVAQVLVDLPEKEQIEVLTEAKAKAKTNKSNKKKKITAESVKAIKREKLEAKGETKHIRRSVKEIREFLVSKTADAEPELGRKLAEMFVDFLDGRKTEEVMHGTWNRTFEIVEIANEDFDDNEDDDLQYDPNMEEDNFDQDDYEEVA